MHSVQSSEWDVFIISELHQLKNRRNEFWITTLFQWWSQSNIFRIFLLAEDWEKKPKPTNN